MSDAPVLQRGIGTITRCRSCKHEIVFALMFSTGKKAPFQKDHEGEWVLENGYAKHAGKRVPVVQTDMFAKPVEEPQRYTAHHATCPNAAEWRSGR